MLTDAAVAGVGIALLPDFLIAAPVRTGALEVLLPEYQSQSSVSAIYPHSRHLSAKVRLFIDFLLEQFTPTPPWKCT